MESEGTLDIVWSKHFHFINEETETRKVEWLSWGRTAAYLRAHIAGYIPPIFTQSPHSHLPDLGPLHSSVALEMSASFLTLSRWWLRPTLVPLAVNYVPGHLSPITVQVLTLENELVPFLFHLVWILMTSSSLTHLPMDFIQWERKPELQLTSRGNRSPQPNHSTTRGLQASVSSSMKWQQQRHLLPGVLSKSNNISHERAKFVVTQRPFV